MGEFMEECSTLRNEEATQSKESKQSFLTVKVDIINTELFQDFLSVMSECFLDKRVPKEVSEEYYYKFSLLMDKYKNSK